MHRPSSGFVLGALTGSALVGAAGYLAGAGWNSSSVEAAGTWVGGLGTIAAVLFAARGLREEQRHRTEEMARQSAALDRELVARQEAAQLDADLVTLTVYGAGGHGVDPDFVLDGLWVEAINSSTHAISEVEVRVHAGEGFRWYRPALQPHETFDAVVDTLPIPAKQSEASRHRLRSYDYEIRFTQAGRRWRRKQGEPARAL